jgi:hypothetical protein
VPAVATRVAGAPGASHASDVATQAIEAPRAKDGRRARFTAAARDTAEARFTAGNS